jgi:hypothetical protein
MARNGRHDDLDPNPDDDDLTPEDLRALVRKEQQRQRGSGGGGGSQTYGWWG